MDFKERMEKLNDLKNQHPELNRAMEINKKLAVIISMWTNDDEFMIAFNELKEFLKGKP